MARQDANPTSLYQVMIVVDGKRYPIGLYRDPARAEEAARAALDSVRYEILPRDTDFVVHCVPAGEPLDRDFTYGYRAENADHP